MRQRSWRVVFPLVAAVALAGFAAHAADCPPPPPGIYDGQEMPEITSRSAPKYPKAARDAGIEGTVVVSALVDCTGEVKDTRIFRSNPSFDSAALDCVRHWRFKSATQAGVPVAAWVAFPIEFRLHSPAEPAAGVPERPREDARLDNPAIEDMPMARRYFINADRADVVRMQFTDKGDWGYWIQPTSREWIGSGVLQGSTYRGTFVYGAYARDPRNRGAEGTHFGTLEPAGRLRIRGRFTNRPLPPFSVTWTPVDTLRRGPNFGKRTVPRQSYEIHSGDWEHPTWPPPDGSGRIGDHPIWPPERGTADRSIVPATGAKSDSLRR